MKFEEVAFLVVFCLLFIGALLTPMRILDQYEVGVLLLVVLPFLGWFVRLIAKDVKQHGK